MTKLLYLDDSYLKECDAIIQSVAGNEVILDQTIFYPRGGGQPSDTGKMIKTDSGIEARVVEVVKKMGIRSISSNEMRNLLLVKKSILY